jgi:hypothetical protein
MERNAKSEPVTASKRAAIILTILLAAGLAAFLALSNNMPAAASHTLHFHCDFTPPEMSEWDFPHPADWASEAENGMTFLHMVRMGQPGVPRRPLQFARLKGVNVGSFSLSVKVRRLQKSMIIVFNYIDTLHFYYAHVSRQTGREVSVHNGIFIVNGGPRYRIAGLDAPPALPGPGWHTIRIVRNARTGLIEVYSDVQKAPLFTAVDKHFDCGQIGLGSFDETGDFADFDLRSTDSGCAPENPVDPQAHPAQQ